MLVRFSMLATKTDRLFDTLTPKIVFGHNELMLIGSFSAPHTTVTF